MNRRTFHIQDTQRPDVESIVLGRFSAVPRFFMWFFVKWVKTAAFSIRVLLRDRLGERRLGGMSILAGFLWIRYFLGGNFKFKSLDHEFALFSSDFFEGRREIFGHWILATMPDVSGHYDLIDYLSLQLDAALWPLYWLIYPLWQFFENLPRLLQFAMITNPNPHEVSLCVFYFSLLFLCIAVIHFAFILKSKNQRTFDHSYKKGRSTVFYWLEDKCIGSFSITPTIISMAIEPVFVFLVGFVFICFDWNFSLLVMLSSLALFIEELWEYQIKKAQVLNVIDSELDGHRVMTEYRKIESRKAKQNHGEQPSVTIL